MAFCFTVYPLRQLLAEVFTVSAIAISEGGNAEGRQARPGWVLLAHRCRYLRKLGSANDRLGRDVPH